MSTAVELESWLRSQAKDRLQKAAARRGYARAGQNLSDEDRKVAHILAEQMMGRRLPQTTRAEERKTAQIEERIASKLDQEAAMLVRFADWVADQQTA